MKTSELTGAALNWAVAKAIGKPCHLYRINHRDRHPAIYMLRGDDGLTPAYSTDWSQAGPIIEREKIGLLHVENTLPHQRWDAGETDEFPNTLFAVSTGPTPLIAAMRCYVASKLGDAIEIPEELL
jgi:hypothetical protein